MPRDPLDGLTEKEKILSCQWPHYPLLPMKRYTKSGMEEGLMIAHRWNMIVLANIWFISGNADYIKNAKILMYEDLDDVLAHGWIGD